MPSSPSGHLLRTLASVPPSSRILVVGSDGGRHVLPLAQLGFEVHTTDDEASAIERLRSYLVSEGQPETADRAVRARPQALGYPDEFFNWAILFLAFARSETSVDEVVDALQEVRRVLASGGWMYIAIDTGTNGVDAEDEHILGLYGLMQRANLELAEKAEIIFDDDLRLVRGIFRRVDATTPK